ncbi:MAG: glycosyltransferase [Aquificaceae bacterium]|nr:glycosyltransferase [Aquificaceae bacterium]
MFLLNVVPLFSHMCYDIPDMRIAFLKYGENLGISRHATALLEAFKRQGAEVQTLDLSEGELQDRVNQLTEFSPTFVLDLNGSCVIFGEREGQKLPIFDVFGYVHVSLFTDEPLFHFPVLLDLQKSNNFLPVVTDLKYADSIKFLGHERGTFYITPFIDPFQMPEPSEEKDIDIVFLGPVVDPNILAQQAVQNLKESFVPYFFEVGEFLFRNPEAHLLYASEYLFSMFNQSFQEEFLKWRQENPHDYLRLLNDISLYATAKKRWFMLSFLEGIDLKIVGVFEGELKEGHQHLSISDWTEALELIGKSYMTILTFPHAVPTGIGFVPLEVAFMESAPFIDLRATLPGFFAPDSEVISYMPLDRADIEEKVVYYLENLQEAKEIGKRAKERVLRGYGPEDRASFLYQMFQDLLSQAQAVQQKTTD